LWKNSFSAALIAVCCLLSTPLVQAEGDPGHELWVYASPSGVDGQVSVGTLESDVDANFSDIVDALDLAFMAGMRSEQGSWAWTVDVYSANLTNDIGRSVTLNTEQHMLRATGGARLESGVELLFGARAVEVGNKLKVALPNNTVASSKDETSWVDPMVGMGYRILDIDYEDGSGNRKFGYDMQAAGPVIGLAWDF
jgi:hypothetical protein